MEPGTAWRQTQRGPPGRLTVIDLMHYRGATIRYLGREGTGGNFCQAILLFHKGDELYFSHRRLCLQS